MQEQQTVAQEKFFLLMKIPTLFGMPNGVFQTNYGRVLKANSNFAMRISVWHAA
jgi:hypothetical protein